MTGLAGLLKQQSQVIHLQAPAPTAALTSDRSRPRRSEVLLGIRPQSKSPSAEQTIPKRRSSGVISASILIAKTRYWSRMTQEKFLSQSRGMNTITSLAA